MSAGFKHVTTEPTTEVTLGVGVHRLMLQVVDDAGVVSEPDTVVVTVEQTGIPAVNYINPDHGHRGDVIDVTVVGVNIENATAVKVFRGDEEDGRILVVIRPGAAAGKLPITLTILEHAPLGPRLLEVTTPFGIATARFSVTAAEMPRLLSITPPSVRPNGRRRVPARIEGDNLDGATAVNFGAGGANDPWVTAEIRQANRDFVDLDLWVSADAAWGKRDFTVSTEAGTAGSPPGRTLSIVPGVLQVGVMAVALVLVAGWIYLALQGGSTLYTLGGLGYLVLLVLLYLPLLQASSWRPVVRWGLIVFAAITIAALVMAANTPLPATYFLVVMAVVLIGLLVAEHFQAGRKR